MQYTWCQALLEVRDNNGIVAIASCCGVAFGVAGLTMFVGMFSCCCCTIDTKPVKIDPKKAKVLNDARAHVCVPQDMFDVDSCLCAPMYVDVDS